MRRSVTALIVLVAMFAIATAPVAASSAPVIPRQTVPSATWHGLNDCPDDHSWRYIREATDRGPTSCWMDRPSSFVATSPRYLMKASVTFADGRTENTALRSDFIFRIECYEGGSGAQVYKAAMAHNLWPGIDATVTISGLFKPPTPGATYLCATRADITPGSNGEGQYFRFAPGPTYDAYAFDRTSKDGGNSTPGSNINGSGFEAWPTSLYNTGPWTTVTTTALKVSDTPITFGTGSSQAGGWITVGANVWLSRCTGADAPNKCSSPPMPVTSGPITANVVLRAWRAQSESSPNTPCPGTMAVTTTATVSISEPTHHSGVNPSLPINVTPGAGQSCGSYSVIRATVTVTVTSPAGGKGWHNTNGSTIYWYNGL